MLIRFDRLLLIDKATVEGALRTFDMRHVCAVYSELPECGTVGCLIGNYNNYAQREPTRFGASKSPFMGDQIHFGITVNEYNWLFMEGPMYHRTIDGIIYPYVRFKRNLADVTKEQALARLRKFIYYKLHKHEMCYDEKYGVKESARRLEGDHLIVHSALEDVKKKHVSLTPH